MTKMVPTCLKRSYAQNWLGAPLPDSDEEKERKLRTITKIMDATDQITTKA